MFLQILSRWDHRRQSFPVSPFEPTGFLQEARLYKIPPVPLRSVSAEAEFQDPPGSWSPAASFCNTRRERRSGTVNPVSESALIPAPPRVWRFELQGRR